MSSSRRFLDFTEKPCKFCLECLAGKLVQLAKSVTIALHRRRTVPRLIILQNVQVLVTRFNFLLLANFIKFDYKLHFDQGQEFYFLFQF